MCTRRHGAHDPFLMFHPSGLSDAQAVSLVGLRLASARRLAFGGWDNTRHFCCGSTIFLFDTTTGWWAECLGVGFVVGRRAAAHRRRRSALSITCGNRFPGNFPEI